ncbi:hypothetical protein [Nesterenkonia sp. PF2B19]|uniref:hypothetical protein n=1 Tax=Nesterenkonia sp. PF2B19 TaxID=1881858 RepID=UPI001F2F6CE0|nr:hypothetical protein [Nesterenkonia sp. PF2B19]
MGGVASATAPVALIASPPADPKRSRSVPPSRETAWTTCSRMLASTACVATSSRPSGAQPRTAALEAPHQVSRRTSPESIVAAYTSGCPSRVEMNAT